MIYWLKNPQHINWSLNTQNSHEYWYCSSDGILGQHEDKEKTIPVRSYSSMKLFLCTPRMQTALFVSDIIISQTNSYGFWSHTVGMWTPGWSRVRLSVALGPFLFNVIRSDHKLAVRANSWGFVLVALEQPPGRIHSEALFKNVGSLWLCAILPALSSCFSIIWCFPLYLSIAIWVVMMKRLGVEFELLLTPWAGIKYIYLSILFYLFLTW